MKISVIVPAYREGERAAQLIHRLARNMKVYEVIVSAVDCEKTLRPLLRNVPKVKFYEAPKRGRGPQLNFGAAAAKGDLLLFLHADSRLEKGALEEMEAAIRSKKVFGGAFRLKFDHPAFKYRVKEWGVELRSRLIGLPYGDQGYFVTRELFERLEGFSNWPLFEDVDFFDRFKALRPWVLLRSHVVTSPRRWEAKGYWTATFKNIFLILLYKLGVPPKRFASYY
ncbi:MAG TPA: TIGR04283 family arsenosugar biosynthesis glycosyltransferase [bacterium]